MVDLIPIGTTNRTPTENNAKKPAEPVEQAELPKALDDSRVSGGTERRRRLDRRMRDDRRRRERGLRERRKLPDRRGQARKSLGKDRNQTSRRPAGRKGRIIDERI